MNKSRWGLIAFCFMMLLFMAACLNDNKTALPKTTKEIITKAPTTIAVYALTINAAGGTATGAGLYGNGDVVLLTAIANEGYIFLDGMIVKHYCQKIVLIHMLWEMMIKL